MKNRIQILLAAALAISATQNSAGTPTNKTFLQPRSQGVNLAAGKTAGWSNLVDRKAHDSFGGNVQATFFMSGSTEKDALAKYFLFNSKAVVALPRAATATGTGGGDNSYVTAAPNATSLGNTSDLDLGLLIHNFNTGALGTGVGVAQNTTGPVASTDAKLALAPEQKTIGVAFNYHQDLKCLLKGLYFSVEVPVANVENSMGLTATGAENAELVKFFQGNRNAIAANLQGAFVNLNKALISGCNRSETGVADVDLILGYKFLDKDSYHMAVNFGVTVPTGNTPDGTYAFDAIVGNAGHVALGVGLDTAFKVWHSECKNHSLKLNFAANYRYLLENDETRTLGLTNQNFGQYLLLIDRTKDANAQQLTPAANVTTLRVDVTPGSQLDGILSMNYNCHGFAFDLGYNLYYRDAEKVKVSSTGCGSSAPQFPDNKWAIATRNADMDDAGLTLPMTTTNNHGSLSMGSLYVNRTIDNKDLDVASAQTPSLLSHKVFGGVGYWTKTWEVPVLVGVGAHYEWADADIVSTWGFNAKLGVGF